MLLSVNRMPWALLQQEVLPYRPAWYWMGLALTFSGLAFTVWTRTCLDTNWSGSVQVKADHQLVRRRP